MERRIAWNSVADTYDAFVRADYDIPFFLEYARAARGPILEVMCGTGRITLPLLEAGLDVTGVDYSEAFTRRLRAKLRVRSLRGVVLDQDARELDLPRTFRLVFVGFHAFSEIPGKPGRALAFGRLARHVAPGGRLILTLHNPPVRAAAVHEEWRSAGQFPVEGRGTVLEVLSRWVLGPGRIAGVQRYVERDGQGTVVGDVSLPIEFDLVEREEVEALGRKEGLEPVHLFGDYQQRPFTPDSPHLLFVFGRPSS